MPIWRLLRPIDTQSDEGGGVGNISLCVVGGCGCGGGGGGGRWNAGRG